MDEEPPAWEPNFYEEGILQFGNGGINQTANYEFQGSYGSNNF